MKIYTIKFLLSNLTVDTAIKFAWNQRRLKSQRTLEKNKQNWRQHAIWF